MTPATLFAMFIIGIILTWWGTKNLIKDFVANLEAKRHLKYRYMMLKGIK